MSKQFVVVHDPENTYYEGSLVDPQRANQLRSRGVVLLPVDPELFKVSAAGGYFRRSWGAGWPLDAPHPVISAQLLIYCAPQYPQVHWVARLGLTEEATASGQDKYLDAQGSLRMVCDSSQRTPYNAKLSPQDPPVDVGSLVKTPQAEGGGWVVGGRARVQCATEGHYGFGLYGHAPGLRVLWAAISATGER